MGHCTTADLPFVTFLPARVVHGLEAAKLSLRWEMILTFKHPLSGFVKRELERQKTRMKAGKREREKTAK